MGKSNTSFVIGLAIGSIIGMVSMCVNEVTPTQEVHCNIQKVTMQEVCSAADDTDVCETSQAVYFNCLRREGGLKIQKDYDKIDEKNKELL